MYIRLSTRLILKIVQIIQIVQIVLRFQSGTRLYKIVYKIVMVRFADEGSQFSQLQIVLQ
jgi:hypothetical protein